MRRRMASASVDSWSWWTASLRARTGCASRRRAAGGRSPSRPSRRSAGVDSRPARRPRAARASRSTAPSRPAHRVAAALQGVAVVHEQRPRAPIRRWAGARRRRSLPVAGQQLRSAAAARGSPRERRAAPGGALAQFGVLVEQQAERAARLTQQARVVRGLAAAPLEGDHARGRVAVASLADLNPRTRCRAPAARRRRRADGALDRVEAGQQPLAGRSC